MSRRILLALAALMLPLGGCGLPDGDGRPTVVASFYPLEFVVHQLAGERIRVLNLTAPGVEPHDLDLKVRQVAEISAADLVVYSDGLQPAVDRAVAQNARRHSLDVGPLVHLEHDNPHFWLDPLRLADAAAGIEERLSSADPGGAATYAANLRRLTDELTRLDQDYARGLRHCERRVVVSSHDAFGYQERYGLEFAPIAGLSPDAEPSPARIADLRRLIDRDHLTTVFAETLASHKMADTLSSELGLRTAVLDPLEGVPEHSTKTYLSIMRANLAALQEANGCTR